MRMHMGRVWGSWQAGERGLPLTIWFRLLLLAGAVELVFPAAAVVEAAGAFAVVLGVVVAAGCGVKLAPVLGPAPAPPAPAPEGALLGADIAVSGVMLPRDE